MCMYTKHMCLYVYMYVNVCLFVHKFLEKLQIELQWYFFCWIKYPYIAARRGPATLIQQVQVESSWGAQDANDISSLNG